MSMNSGFEQETLKSMELKNQQSDSCPDQKHLSTGKRETIDETNSEEDNIKLRRKLPPVIYAGFHEHPYVYLTNSPVEPTDPTKEPSIKAKDEANNDHSSAILNQDSDDEQTESDDEIIDAEPISFVPPSPDAMVFNHPISQDKCGKRKRHKDIYGRLADLEQQEWLNDTWMVEARERTNGKFDLFFHHRIFKYMCRSKVEVHDFIRGMAKKERVPRDEQLTVYSEIFGRNGDYLISPGGKSVITTAGSRPRKLKNISVAPKIEDNEVKPSFGFL